jgi:methylase of polypeptide subunit release factors
MTSRDEREALEHFRERYAVPATDVAAQIEASVIGAVWGANGYTTLEQADELARRLALQPGRRVLDLGTGRGWPGGYFASRYGCDVVGTDMPFDALSAARRRAASERVNGSFAAVAAAGAHQPFRPASFHAVVHTDVLC